MSPHDGLFQKLRNCVNICQSYSEKTIGFFFSGHGVDCDTSKAIIQEAQLPQSNSASAAHMEVGARPSSPFPLRPLWLHLCVWSNPKPATNVRQACRPLSAL